MKPSLSVLCVVGYIDYLGIIHFRLLSLNDLEHNPGHEELFPGVPQPKRWRFLVSKWVLQESVLSPEPLTEEDRESIPRLMGEILGPTLPDWLRKKLAPGLLTPTRHFRSF